MLYSRADKKKLMGRIRLSKCAWEFALLLAGILLMGDVARGQITSSMPFEHPVLLNPALVGAGQGIRVNTLYRNQWLNLKSPYNTIGTTYDMHFGLYDNHNIGVSVLDNIEGDGVLHHAETYLYYAYMVDVTYDFRLRLGVQAGGIFKMSNYSNLIFPDMLGPKGNQSPNYANKLEFAPDFGLGVVADYLGWNIGVSAHHITEPTYDVRNAYYLKTPRLFNVYIRKDISLNGRHRFDPQLVISPMLLINYTDNWQVSLGGEVEYLGIKAGVLFRESIDYAVHNFSAILGWQGSWFGIAYSYGVDVMSEGFFGLNSSVHELKLGITIPQGRRRGLAKTYGKHGKRKKYIHYSRKRSGAARRRRRYRVR